MQKTFTRELKGPQIFLLVLSRLALQQQMSNADHRIQRRPQLMAHDAQKLRFGLGRLLGLLLHLHQLLFPLVPARDIPDKSAVIRFTFVFDRRHRQLDRKFFLVLPDSRQLQALIQYRAAVALMKALKAVPIRIFIR
jgi:hypothetical protein